MQILAERLRKRKISIGFVPTMGALHQGHLSLIRQARKECDVCVVSIFVNPLQFGPKEDFRRYPRPNEKDRRLISRMGVDVLFAPNVKEMYRGEGKGGGTRVEPPASLVNTMCGASRPGHFRGVATVVAKLFHAVQPHQAYFGQKDAQQCAVIQRMVRDLNWPVKIRVMPIVRESDGLAMSSRNVYFSPDERQGTLVLSKSLKAAALLIKGGERRSARLKVKMAGWIRQESLARLEYVVVVHPETLQPVARLSGSVLVALAVWIGKTRLIDNRIFRVV